MKKKKDPVLEHNEELYRWRPVPSFKDPPRWPGYVPYNTPKHQPDHFHENGFDSRCGRCLDLRERSRRDR